MSKTRKCARCGRTKSRGGRWVKDARQPSREFCCADCLECTRHEEFVARHGVSESFQKADGLAHLAGEER